MVTKATPFLIICCFVLIVINSIPQGLDARELEDIPQNSNLTGGNNHEKGQSRIGVQPSKSGHAGSAHGDQSPPGTVQMPPPTATTVITNSGAGTNRQPSGYNYYSPPANQENGYYVSPPYYNQP